MSRDPNSEFNLEGERGAGISSAADETNAQSNAGKALAVVALGLAAVGFIYLNFSSEEKKKEVEPKRANISAAAPFTPAAPRHVEERPQPIPLEKVVFETKNPEPDNEMLEASMRAPVVAFSANLSSRRNQNRNGNQTDGGFDPSLPAELGGGASASSLNNKLQPTKIEGVSATVLNNLHMVIPQGTTIPCVLQTAISSDQAGFVSCVFQRDILSASGQVVLLEKGTSVVGEYQGGMKKGQQRLFVLWNRARTPKGVVVNLASPAIDGVGRSGFDGKIDTHFWERFGGAMFMSVFADSSKYAFSRLNDGSAIDSENTGDAVQSSANIALEHSISIPPTLYKNQGEQVAIFVARDLDFSNVYSLRTAETQTQIFDRAVTGDMRRASGIVTK